MPLPEHQVDVVVIGGGVMGTEGRLLARWIVERQPHLSLDAFRISRVMR